MLTLLLVVVCNAIHQDISHSDAAELCVLSSRADIGNVQHFVLAFGAVCVMIGWSAQVSFQADNNAVKLATLAVLWRVLAAGPVALVSMPTLHYKHAVVPHIWKPLLVLGLKLCRVQAGTCSCFARPTDSACYIAGLLGFVVRSQRRHTRLKTTITWAWHAVQSVHAWYIPEPCGRQTLAFWSRSCQVLCLDEL
jgi:hypothetical protein